MGWQGSTLPTKPNHPSSQNAIRLKITLSSTQSLPSGRANSFLGTGWAYFPVTFLLEKEAERAKACSIIFGTAGSVPVGPGR